MTKLLFNPLTKSVVMALNHTYYDMRTGSRIGDPGKLPKLKPFPLYTKSKFDKLNPTSETIELDGHQIDIIQNPDNQDEWQLGGHLPRYFWKGYIKLVRDGLLSV